MRHPWWQLQEGRLILIIKSLSEGWTRSPDIPRGAILLVEEKTVDEAAKNALVFGEKEEDWHSDDKIAVDFFFFVGKPLQTRFGVEEDSRQKVSKLPS